MIKILGLGFVFAALTSMGFYYGECSRQKLYQIKRADNFLSDIIIGIEEKRLSVNMIFENIKKKKDEKTGAFIESVKTLIKSMSIERFNECCSKTGFCQDGECIDALFYALSVFGKYKADEQVSEIKICREKIRRRYDNMEADIKEKIKIYRTLGVLSGFCMVIILI